MTFKIIKETKSLTEDAKLHLKTLAEHLDSMSESKFVKFEDGQKAVFEFLPEQTAVIYKKWDGQKFTESQTKDGEDYKLNYRFVVHDPNLGNKERIWDVTNFKAAKTIVSYLQEGVTVLKIKRIGEKKDTIYDVEPVGGGLQWEEGNDEDEGKEEYDF